MVDDDNYLRQSRDALGKHALRLLAYDIVACDTGLYVYLICYIIKTIQTSFQTHVLLKTFLISRPFI